MKRFKILSIGCLLALTLACFIFSASSVFAFETEKQLDEVEVEITVSLNDLTIELTDNSGVAGRTYQYWIRQNVLSGTVNEKEVYTQKWVFLEQSSELSYTDNIAELCDIDGYYYVLIRVLENGKTYQYYEVISAESATMSVSAIKSENVEVNLLETNYYPAGNQLTWQIVGNADYYILGYKDESIRDTDGTVSWTPDEGNNTVVIECYDDEGVLKSVLDIEVVGYKYRNEYSVINGLKINGSGNYGEGVKSSDSEVEFSLDTNGVNSPAVSPPEKYYVNGKEIAGSTYEFDRYGVYVIRAELVNSSGEIEDFYEAYYNYYGSAEMTGISDMTLNIGAQETVDISASGLDGAASYTLLREDADGWKTVAVTDEPSFSISHSKNGKYYYEARAKGENAGSFEVRRRFTVTVGGDEAVPGGSIEFYNIDNNELTEGEIQAQTPYYVKVSGVLDDGVLYKFIVSTMGQYSVKQSFTVKDAFVWIPSKPAVYTIEVRLLKNGRYGYTDTTLFKTQVEVFNLPDYEDDNNIDSRFISAINTNKSVIYNEWTNETLTTSENLVTSDMFSLLNTALVFKPATGADAVAYKATDGGAANGGPAFQLYTPTYYYSTGSNDGVDMMRFGAPWLWEYARVLGYRYLTVEFNITARTNAFVGGVNGSDQSVWEADYYKVFDGTVEAKVTKTVSIDLYTVLRDYDYAFLGTRDAYGFITGIYFTSTIANPYEEGISDNLIKALKTDRTEDEGVYTSANLVSTEMFTELNMRLGSVAGTDYIMYKATDGGAANGGPCYQMYLPTAAGGVDSRDMAVFGFKELWAYARSLNYTTLVLEINTASSAGGSAAVRAGGANEPFDTGFEVTPARTLTDKVTEVFEINLTVTLDKAYEYAFVMCRGAYCFITGLYFQSAAN